MGKMIVCHTPVAANPYEIEDGNLSIYSLEEIACYIQENSVLLDEKFMRISLCEWIGEELKQDELAEKLREVIRERKTTADFIRLLLNATDYLSREEIRRVVHEVSSMEEKSEYERRKLRADTFCRKGNYAGAIHEYRLIVTKDFYPKPDALFLGAVWHNMGTAYARLFLFAEAEEAFEKAYAHNEKSFSLQALLCSALCRKNDAHFKELCSRYYLDERTAQKLVTEYRRAGESYTTHRYFDRLNDIMDNEERTMEDLAAQQELLSILKADYRSLSKL